ncbi:hypothetical protein B0H14DRAFT_3883265 [Mycena olivaceomarginata]|nr:hypothetical protein B0H14DRAFT_3883265 [Mycena olivaceomarginata]
MALCVPNGFTHVTDFQGHVLDSIGNGNSIANNRIVTGFPRNVPTSANQQWLFTPIPSPTNDTFIVINGNSPDPFLSSVANGMVRLSQVATVATPVNITVECLTTSTARIRDALFQSVLIGWPAQQGLSPHPVTWEDFTGGPQQTWSFVT